MSSVGQCPRCKKEVSSYEHVCEPQLDRQRLRNFLRGLIVQGAAIREDFRADGRNLIPGFKERIEAATDERLEEFDKLMGEK